MNLFESKILGFSGTQLGMTEPQRLAFVALLKSLSPTEFHHGDCVGADAEAHHAVRTNSSCRTVIHPPLNEVKRAFCEGDQVHHPKTYLARNRVIVRAVDEMIIVPYEDHPKLRSGTWSTFRYAQELGRKIHLIYTTGQVFTK